MDERGRKTYLSRVDESKRCHLGNSLGNVGIGTDDRWVVAAAKLSVLAFELDYHQRNTYSSRVTLFNVLLQLSITFFPVAVDPVKLTLSMPGCAVNMGPKLSPPLKACTTPGGKNDCASSTSLRPQ